MYVPSSVEAFRVFIASPGGLEDERAVVREEILKFNSSYMYELRATFSAHGWEDVPGSMRRPQGVINEDIAGCDYMILMLGSRWGSQTAVDSRYSSGTEEEFYIARSLMREDAKPMQDVLVLFKGVSESQLSDPGEQLKKVLAFKVRLNEEKDVFYKSFDDLSGLRFEVATRLHRWALERHGAAPLRPDSLASLTVAVPSKRDLAGESDPGSLEALAIAEKYEARGLVVQAESAYAAAAVDDEVVVLEKYARFLRRTGRLTKSLDVNRRILAMPVDQSAEAASQRSRAYALANIGIIERKTGSLHSSRSSLREAVQTARAGGEELFEALAYALDNLSITASRNGDDEESARCLDEALGVRREVGDDPGIAKTLVNLTRLYKRTNRLERAKEICAEAISFLEGSSERSALASAHAAMGEILEEEGNLDAAEQAYRRGLEINESLGRPDVIALSLTQIGRVLIAKDDLPAAERYAQRSLDENEHASNREGVTASNHLLGRIYTATERTDLAISMLERVAGDYVSSRNPTGEAWARLNLARAQHQAGHDRAAEESIQRARFLAGGSENGSLQRQVAEELNKPHGSSN